MVQRSSDAGMPIQGGPIASQGLTIWLCDRHAKPWHPSPILETWCGTLRDHGLMMVNGWWLMVGIPMAQWLMGSWVNGWSRGILPPSFGGLMVDGWKMANPMSQNGYRVFWRAFEGSSPKWNDLYVNKWPPLNKQINRYMYFSPLILAPAHLTSSHLTAAHLTCAHVPYFCASYTCTPYISLHLHIRTCYMRTFYICTSCICTPYIFTSYIRTSYTCASYTCKLPASPTYSYTF